jgi:hypothetical protein
LAVSIDHLNGVLQKLESRLGTTGKAVDTFGKRFSDHVKKLKEAIEGFGDRSVDLVFNKLTRMASPEFVLEAAGKVIGATAAVTAEMVKAAATAERTNKSFEMVFGAKGGAEMLELTESMAKNTEFTSDALKGAVLQLGKAGFAGNDLVRANKAAADIASFSTNPAEGQSDAIAALSHVKQTGRVDPALLSGLGIEKTFFDELANRTGQSTATLKQKLEKGKIDASQSLDALYAAISQKTGKSLGGAGEEMSKTMSARLTHLSDLPNEYYQKLAKSEGFAKMSDTFGKLLDELDPASPRGKQIFAALEGAFDTVSSIVNSIDLAGIIEAGASAVERLSTGFLRLLSMIPGETGTNASVELANITHRQEERQRKIAEDAEFKRRATERGTTPDFERAATNAKIEAAEIAKHAAEGYAGGLTDSERIAFESSYDVGDKSLEAMRDALGVNSPSKRFAEIGEFSGQGYALGLDRGMSNAFDELPSMVKQGTDSTPVVPLLSARGASQISAGAPQITIAPQVTVNLNGKSGSDAAAAQAAGQAVANITVTALQSALDNLAIQSGAS